MCPCQNFCTLHILFQPSPLIWHIPDIHTAYPIPSHTDLTHLSDLACPSDLVCSSDLACPCCTPHIWHILIFITQFQHSLHYNVGLHILKVPRVPSHSVPKSSTFSESIDRMALILYIYLQKIILSPS